ncbi:hypothetical protein BGZ65_011203, partial [Modicella reniformis]
MFICEAMTEYPNNTHFEANVEFSNLVRCFFSKRYQMFTQIIFFITIQTTNIASIAICSQLFDNLLIRIFQLAMVLIGPLCLMSLSSNVWIQVVSCSLILLIFVQWTATFFEHGLVPARVPPVGSDMSRMFESILFNYAFVTAVPSFANAKRPDVSIHKAVGTSVTIMTSLFILVSIVGGMAFDIPTNSTMIQAINSTPGVSTLSQIAGFTFPIVAFITSIPVNTIVLRYNLVQSEVCNKSWANIMAGMVPWLVAIPCMTGSGLPIA